MTWHEIKKLETAPKETLVMKIKFFIHLKILFLGQQLQLKNYQFKT